LASLGPQLAVITGIITIVIYNKLSPTAQLTESIGYLLRLVRISISAEWYLW
jgi:hypothetical protein